MNDLRYPLRMAEELAEEAVGELSRWTSRIVIAGSIRRRVPQVKDVEIVAIPKTVPDGLFGEPRPAIEELRERAKTLGSKAPKVGGRYVQVLELLGSPLTLDLFIVTPPAEWGPILAIRTGPARFSMKLVTRIRGRGWFCKDGRVVDEHGRLVSCPEERDFFAAARMEYVDPPNRKNPPQLPTTLP